LEQRNQAAEIAVDQFGHVTPFLSELDLESIWEEATVAERRNFVEDLVDSVHFYPDRLTVQVAGAPPILVTLEEVGLHAGSKPVVLESRRNRSGTKHGRLAE
jgi:hypothetical protein